MAIIGGGLAGITAAAAANNKGCKVELYEALDELLPIQRGNYTRYVHPNIYDWPNKGAEENKTNLPFLNWEAGVTDKVIKQIEKDWGRVNRDIIIRLKHKVNSISKSNGKPALSVIDPFVDEEYDCVIIATGFGLERTTLNAPKKFYWMSEDFHQPRQTDKKPETWMVSGCGDGGLIDALRLTLKDFTHEDFTLELLQDSSLESIKHRLIDIDNNIPKDCDDVSRYLHSEYKKLELPAELLKKIAKRIRADTKVTLVGKAKTPFSPNSSLLNRFAIFLVLQANKLPYMSGEVMSVEHAADGYKINFKLNDNEQTVLDFDNLVQRHGPVAVIGDLVKNRITTDSDIDNETAKKLWSDDFYESTPNPPQTPVEKAGLLRLPLQREISKVRGVSEVGVAIGGTENNPLLLVSYSGKLTKALMKMDNYESFPVEFIKNRIFMVNMNAEIAPSDREASMPEVLTSGARIRNKTARGGIGTLGCFVTMTNGRTGFLSTNHVLVGNGKLDNKIVALKEDGFEWEIGRLEKFVDSRKSKGRSGVMGFMDAAIAILNPGVSFSPNLTIAKQRIVFKEVSKPMLGTKVIKNGAGSGLTKGSVEAINGTFHLQMDKDERRILRDMILIRSESEKPFASNGDSGSVVFDEMGHVFGIVVGSSGIFTLVFPLQPILDKFECRLYVNRH